MQGQYNKSQNKNLLCTKIFAEKLLKHSFNIAETRPGLIIKQRNFWHSLREEGGGKIVRKFLSRDVFEQYNGTVV